MAEHDSTFNRYAEAHKSPQGPGDARPTALQIIEDENLEGKLTDKTILVTGGSSGIGVETVRALSHTGAHIVVGVRNVAKGQAVLNDITKDPTIKTSQLELLEMDLNSLASVRTAATTYLSKHKQLHILILNAGVYIRPTLARLIVLGIGGVSQAKTKDGFESHFGVNHLSHFLLFSLLRPTLLATPSPRVIIVSSLIHRFSPTLLSDPNFESTPYDPAIAYASSKTANIWFANHLSRLYPQITAISLHPGGIETGLQAHHDPAYLKLMEQFYAAYPEIKTAFKSCEQGAATTVLAAVGKEFQGRGGIYMEDCAVAEEWKEGDSVFAGGYAKFAFDEENETKLWEISERMIG